MPEVKIPEKENRAADGLKKAEDMVLDFMENRMNRDQVAASSCLTESAKKQYSLPGLTLVGTSNPHFSSFEILEKEKDGL